MTKDTKKVLTYAGIVAVGIVLFVIILTACGCNSPIRMAPGEDQKQTRDAALQIAQAVQAHGLPPATPAGRALVAAVQEAAVEAGPPEQPINVEDLIPPSTAQAWVTGRDQVATLRNKAALLLRGLSSQSTRAARLAESAASAETPMQPADVVLAMEELAQSAAESLDLAASVIVPDDPQITEAEARAAELVEDNVKEISRAAVASGTRRATVLDVADTALDEASWWTENATELGIGIPGLGAIVTAIGIGKRLVKKRREYESRTRSGEQIIRGVQAFLDSPVAKGEIGGDAIGDQLKAYLSGQDAETKAFVDQVQAASKGT